MLTPVKLNIFTHRRALLVLYDRSILAHASFLTHFGPKSFLAKVK
jgi:hypothetical protein